MTLYGFIVMAWLIRPNYTAPAIPFATLAACEEALKKDVGGECVATGVKQ